MSLDRLRTLAPPPAEPVEAGTPGGWPAVEEKLGTPLPADYRALTNLYGSGSFDDFLYLFNPFTGGDDGNLLHERDAVLGAYITSRAKFPDRYPHPPFPEPGGLLPLGRSDNGDELFWLTEGEPDGWAVAVLGARGARLEVHRTTVTGFLAALLAGELKTSLFPDDIRGRERHEFVPFD